MANSTKILTIVGARPQFIKASVLSRALQNQDGIEEVIVHTGQHFAENMSEVFFRELGIPSPKYNLGIDSLTHGAMTGKMLAGIEEVVLTEDPEHVLVYGDTNSTLAGALAAVKLRKRIAHVEAGLRSFDMRMPEEVNRVLTDRISDLLFCPTRAAVENLAREGFENFPCRIIESGDVTFDSVLYHRKQARLSPGMATRSPELENGFVLCTIHRAENTDDPTRIINILSALEEIHQSIPVLLLTHPRTKKVLAKLKLVPKLWQADPVGYLEMLYLLERSTLVMTDSGGLQKEAFFMQKCCVTLRDNTEWTELVELGVNFVAGHERNSILTAFQLCLTGRPDFSATPYGDGTAGERIAATLAQQS